MKDTAALRTELVQLLDKLKRNIDKVGIKVLKTQYAKPYRELCQSICAVSSEYVKGIVLKDLRIRKEFTAEFIPVIEDAIARSKILRQISQAAFKRQSITEIDTLALSLRGYIQDSLETAYSGHIGLYITEQNLDNPDCPPLFYNEVTGCIWENEKWRPLAEKDPPGIVLFIKEKKTAETAA